MANKTLFQTIFGAFIPATNTVNHEGAPAYKLSPKQALAQYAATGCFNRTFYASAEEQLTRVLELCEEVGPEFVAAVAIYSRRNAYMKDMPALLCAWLSGRDARLHEFVFARVIDNMKMLRTYVQILRSGVTGRKSLGTAPKRLVREWIAARTEDQLFRASVGQDPSFGDILRMVHPKPADATREAFYGYMLGRRHNEQALPELVLQYEAFRAGKPVDAPDLPFQMLTDLPLSLGDWVAIASRASWQTTRMNLNTFARKGAFEVPGVTETVANRLRDPAEIAKARVFPYQLMVAWKNCSNDVPVAVRDALQDAMEIAIGNVPAFAGKVYVCPDVSGSMRSPVTGARKGSTSAVTCVDVAALMAAAILRRNPSAEVIPFETGVVSIRLNSRDSVMTNAEKLGSIGGGGTNCSAPLRLLNKRQAEGDVVIFVSDNESWVDQGCKRGTALMGAWEEFRKRNPSAKLVCVDVQPCETSQVTERADILNVGGFSDQVFDLIAAFAAGELNGDHWVRRIQQLVM